MNRYMASALVLLVLAAPAAAQSTKAIDLVPDDALGFLLVKDLQGLSDKVDQLARKVNVPEKVSLLQLLQSEFGVKEGIDPKGSVVFIVLKGKDEKSMLGSVLVLPAADAAKIGEQLGVKELKDSIAEGEMSMGSGLLAGIGGKGRQDQPKKMPVVVAKRDSFVLVAPREARDSLETILNSKKSITARIKDVQPWLDKQDILGICTSNGVSTGLAMFLRGPGGSIQSSSPAQYQHMKTTFAEVEKNVQFVAFGGQMENSGNWRLSTAVHFQPDSSYAKWIAQAKALDNKLLDRFPDQPRLATALARLSEQTTFAGVAKFLYCHLPADKADTLTAQFQKLAQQLSDVGMCMYIDKSGGLPFRGKGEGDEGLSVKPVLLAQVKDAAAFLDAAVDLCKNSHGATQSTAKTKTEIDYQQKEIGGKPSRIITVKHGEADRGPVIVLSALDGTTVLGCLLNDATQAEALISKFSKTEKNLSANADMRKTRDLLPKNLQVEVFLDLQAFRILNYFTSGKQESGVPPLGFSIGVIPAGVEAQFVIPFEAFKAVVDASKRTK